MEGLALLENERGVFIELANRKRNRLKGYDYSQNGAYFITICTEAKKKILSNIVGEGILDVPKNKLTEYGIIVKNAIEYINKNNKDLIIDKYVIMPNHVHLIVMVSNGTSGMPSPTNKMNEIIPKFVSSLKRFVNKQIGHSIFQRSFHDHIIHNEADYKNIWLYIDNNPLKWELDCFYSK